MSFAAGLLGGIADGVNARKEREERKRELSVMEAMATARKSESYQGSTPSGGGYYQGSDGGAAGFDPSKLDSSLRQGIIDTAAALQMDPADLATIISYETGGTFDPTKRGPTTQWGQHRGLIQFGEPQAQQYGVDWNNPLGSQLGADGAIVKYYRDRGWKPGMGMMDAYSVVNAGRPGRYNASDANNGGAPGSVADKVKTQMGGHRAKAMALLGYNPEPAAAPAPETDKPPAWAWFHKRANGGAQ